MESSLSRREAFWALNGLPTIGPVSCNRLLDRFGGDPRRVLEAPRGELETVKGLNAKSIDVLRSWEQHFNLPKEMEQAKRRGVDFISREDADYPESLLQISDPPIGLYRLGKYDFKKPSVAIVGTRHCTIYGQSIARSFAKDLASLGFCVVSGMARGIDTFAHKGALEAQRGSTVCVFGCGIDIVYPPENFDLFKEVQLHGAVVSEFPFGRRADRQTFPMRNRLVSGMSHAVIVVESDEAGGSMITARFAGEQGRLICAVPGRIDQKASRGCHQLIQDGALLLTSVDQLLEELKHLKLSPSLQLSEPSSTDEADAGSFEGSESALAQTLGGGESLGIEELAEKLDLPVSDVSVALMTMELRGVVARRLDGRYELAVRLNR